MKPALNPFFIFIYFYYCWLRLCYVRKIKWNTRERFIPLFSIEIFHRSKQKNIRFQCYKIWSSFIFFQRNLKHFVLLQLLNGRNAYCFYSPQECHVIYDKSTPAMEKIQCLSYWCVVEKNLSLNHFCVPAISNKN